VNKPKTTTTRQAIKASKASERPPTVMTYQLQEVGTEAPRMARKAAPDNVVNIKRAVKIEPLEGWTVQTKYGPLRLQDGTDCVRLEDVHSWMCGNGKAPKSATYAVFGSLLEVAGEVDSGDFARLDTLLSLRLANASAGPLSVFMQVNSCRWDPNPKKCECMKAVTVRVSHPNGNFKKDTYIQRFVLPVALAKSRDVQFLKSAFPDLGHVHFEDDTPGGFIYAMGEGAARVWFGAVDPASDHLAAYDAQKAREADAKHQIRWPKDESLSTLLARLAVPVAVAHDLWGWGRAVALQPDAVATPEQAKPKTLDRYDWKGNPELFARLQQDFDSAPGKNIKEKQLHVAEKWGLSFAMVKRQLDEGKKPIAKGEKERRARK
jgi:hypothetical protein